MAISLFNMQESIPTSLLKLSADNSSRAVKMFAGIQRYMDEAQEGLNTSQSIDIVQKLLHQGLKRPELKDELFMQLLKQSRGNPSPAAAGMHQAGRLQDFVRAALRVSASTSLCYT